VCASSLRRRVRVRFWPPSRWERGEGIPAAWTRATTLTLSRRERALAHCLPLVGYHSHFDGRALLLYIAQKREGAMAKKYIVTLTDEERAQLHAMTRRGTVSARRLTRAHLLLQADAGLSDGAIAQALHIGTATVERVRKRFVEDGLEAALGERPRPGGQRKLDGRQEAFLIALACSTPPEGRQCWTMQLLADKLVELRVIEAISDETVRRALKKMPSSRGRGRAGASPV
jgi:transposase